MLGNEGGGGLLDRMTIGAESALRFGRVRLASPDRPFAAETRDGGEKTKGWLEGC